MIGIYKIISPSGRIYIGQSVDISERIRRYKKMVISVKSQPKLYNSFFKYGVNNHMFEVIEECLVEELDEKELYWGLYYNVLEEGLNLKLGNGKGFISEETKNKISKSNSKPKPPGFDEKISEKTKGRKAIVTWGDKISKSLTGIKRSEETKRKISLSKIGFKFTEEQKEKIRNSPNRKENISNAKSKKPIFCITNNKIYKNLREVNEGLGISITLINNVLKNGGIAKGYEFIYLHNKK